MYTNLEWDPPKAKLDFYQETATHCWKNGENVAAFFESSNVAFSKVGSLPFLRINNLKNLLTVKYIEKLFFCISSDPTAFTKTLESSNRTLYINTKNSVNVIKAVLDDSTLTALSKIATIISHLKMYPNLSANVVLKAAHQQIPAEDARIKNAYRFEIFLRPDYMVDDLAGASRRGGFVRNRTLPEDVYVNTDEGFMLALDLSAFAMTSDDQNEKFSDFRVCNNSKSVFTKEDPERIINKCYRLIEILKEEEFFEDLTRAKLHYILGFSSSELTPSLYYSVSELHRPEVSKQIARDAETEVRKSLDDVIGLNPRLILRQTLLASEYEFFIKSIRDFHTKYSAINSKEYIFLILAKIFIKLGKSRFQEAVLYLKTKDLFPQDIAYIFFDEPILKFFKNDFEKLMAPDLENYPLAWILELYGIHDVDDNLDIVI